MFCRMPAERASKPAFLLRNRALSILRWSTTPENRRARWARAAPAPSAEEDIPFRRAAGRTSRPRITTRGGRTGGWSAESAAEWDWTSPGSSVGARTSAGGPGSSKGRPTCTAPRRSDATWPDTPPIRPPTTDRRGISRRRSVAPLN